MQNKCYRSCNFCSLEKVNGPSFDSNSSGLNHAEKPRDHRHLLFLQAVFRRAGFNFPSASLVRRKCCGVPDGGLGLGVGDPGVGDPGVDDLEGFSCGRCIQLNHH